MHLLSCVYVSSGNFSGELEASLLCHPFICATSALAKVLLIAVLHSSQSVSCLQFFFLAALVNAFPSEGGF